MNADLVVTDLDGTLWADDEVLAEPTRDAVVELAQAGVPVLAATGRRANSASRGLQANGLNWPAVLLNGALGLRAGFDDAFFLQPFSNDESSTVVATLAAVGISPVAYTRGPQPDCFIGDRPTTGAAHLEMIAPTVEQGSLSEVAQTESLLCFSVLGVPEDTARTGFAALVAEGFSDVIVSDDAFYGWSLFLQPNGISKWRGVEAYCEQAGLDAGRVLAIGDGGNDRELLEGASISVAIEGGDDRALAVADHVVDPPGRGGWARILELL